MQYAHDRHADRPWPDVRSPMFSYRWTHCFSIAPLEAVLDAVEAFFTTLSPERYRLTQRERFCCEFRRGAWRRRWFDASARVPRFLGIDRRNVATWPTLLTVTALPSPETFELTVHHNVQLPNGLPLAAGHREAGSTAFDQELDGLVEYLKTFLKLPVRPDVRRTDDDAVDAE